MQVPRFESVCRCRAIFLNVLLLIYVAIHACVFTFGDHAFFCINCSLTYAGQWRCPCEAAPSVERLLSAQRRAGGGRGVCACVQ